MYANLSNRELLLLAAQATGMNVNQESQYRVPELFDNDAHREWNPLTDDGDALRLAVKLGLLVDCDDVLKESEVVLTMRGHDDDYVRATEPYREDKYAATRRAIVRAAAEIGKSMK